MRNKYLQFALGMIVGGLLCGTTAAAADYLTAAASTQRFYLNGQPVQFEAYVIHGSPPGCCSRPGWSHAH